MLLLVVMRKGLASGTFPEKDTTLFLRTELVTSVRGTNFSMLEHFKLRKNLCERIYNF